MAEQYSVAETRRRDATMEDRANPAAGTLTDKVAANIKAFVASRFPLFVSTGLDETSSLLERGIIDSLGILDVAAHLETEFGITVENEDVSPENFDSVAALTEFVLLKRSGV